MYITVCKSKVTNATVTQAELYYEGSITIDDKILKAVGILPGEKVEILNVNNGIRIETYAIAGKPNSGQIRLNGPAARFGCVDDTIIILSYGLLDEKDAKNYKMKIVRLDGNNKIKD